MHTCTHAHALHTHTHSNFIVGFEVMPFSIKHSYYGKWNASAVPYHRLTTCAGDPPNGRFERHQPQVKKRRGCASGGLRQWVADPPY
jgi:hypothetical protein